MNIFLVEGYEPPYPVFAGVVGQVVKYALRLDVAIAKRLEWKLEPFAAPRKGILDARRLLPWKGFPIMLHGQMTDRLFKTPFLKNQGDRSRGERI